MLKDSIITMKSMNFIEHCIYFLLFTINKWLERINITYFEKFLDGFENSMIKKYIDGTECPSQEIPSIEAKYLTDENFRKLSNNYRNPVVITGLLNNSDAVNKWDFEYLNSIIGDFKVLTIKYTNEFEIDNVSFSDFVSTLYEDRYINNNHTIFANFPKLFEDIRPQFEYLMNTLKSCNLKNIHIANLFIGKRKEGKICAGSNMHCGGSGNFFCMIRGRKHWTLIHPKYSCLLKGRIADNGVHGQTLFDMADSRLDVQPKIFKCLPRYEVILEEGTILYNPPWWWHRIRNDNGINIGVAIRNNKVTMLNLYNNLTYTLSGHIYLIYNTLVISLYEKYIGNKKHFTTSHSEKKSVLYQIEKLIKKYPTSINLDQIIENKIIKYQK